MSDPRDISSIPDWKCERYLLGELDEGERADIERRLEQDEALRDRLAKLERSNRDILAQYPVAFMSEQIERKRAAERSTARGEARNRARRRPAFVWVPVALMAGVAAVLLLSPARVSELGSPDPITTRIKGSTAELSLFRRTPAGSERLENGALAFENDRILPGYRSDGQGFGLIVSVDGRGVLSRHLPDSGEKAERLLSGTHTLEFSYELDDAPRWEIFILASAEAVFPVRAVLEAIEESPLVQNPGLSVAAADSVLLTLHLPEAVSLSTLTLIKEADDER